MLTTLSNNGTVPQARRNAIADGLARLWRGEQPVGRAFWGYLVIGTFVVLMPTMLLVAVCVTFELKPLALLCAFAGRVGYPIVAAVGVWRSANRQILREGRAPLLQSPAIWRGALAKLGVLFWLGALVHSIMPFDELLRAIGVIGVR